MGQDKKDPLNKQRGADLGKARGFAGDGPYAAPRGQGSEEVGRRAVIEAPFALRREEVEGLPRDAVVAAQVPLGLAPEVLDAVDVGAAAGVAPGLVDPHVPETGDVEHV